MELVLLIILWGMQLYTYILLANVLMSWFPSAKESKIGSLIEKISEPYLAPFRKFIPSIGPLDISPIVAFLTLNLAMTGLVKLFAMTGLVSL